MIDTSQAIVQLTALGYEPSDRVHLRLIGDGGAKNLDCFVNQLATIEQPRGRGLYFVVAPGGQSDKDITKCRSLFCEWDDKPQGWQKIAFTEFGLPVPTLQVDTGGKSVHNYWRLTEPISPELWRQIQSDLLDFVDADRCLKNPSRVMRLAGSFHQKTGKQARIIHHQDVSYSYQELRRLIPGKQAKPTPPPPVNGDDALYKCLAIEHRRLIDSGVGEGGRNHTAFKLASDLIGTANWLAVQSVSSDPRRLYDQFCDRCQPPLDDRERDAVWRSAERSNPSPCLSADKLETCLRVIQAPAQSNSKPCKPVAVSPAPEPVTRSEVDAILTQSATDFDITGLLPERLTTAIQSKAKSLNLPAAAFVGAFLPIAAGLIPHRLQLDADFTIPPILWCGLVGEAGSAKSPILATFKNPLDKLQAVAYETYQTRLREWETCKRGRDETPDPPPVRNFFYVQDTTTESLSVALAGRPCVTVIADELSGFIRGLNQYKSAGRGNDRQTWLSLFDGGALDVLRKTNQVHIAKAAVSLCGGVQPQVLTQVINGDADVIDGFWSRFCWVQVPMTKLPLTGQFNSISLTPMLEALYRELADNDDPQIYKLSAGALQELNRWESECESQKTKEPNNFLRALLPKARQRAARIALVLHCIQAAFDQQQPGGYIQPDTMREAVRLTRWLLHQARMVFADSGYTDSPEAQRIAKFVTRFTGMEVTPKTVRGWWAGRTKPSLQSIRDFMQKVVSLGHATVHQGAVDDPGFIIRLGDYGDYRGDYAGSHLLNTDGADVTAAGDYGDYDPKKNGHKGKKNGDDHKKDFFCSHVVTTTLEAPTGGHSEGDYAGSHPVVTVVTSDEPPTPPPEQYNGNTQVCKVDVPEFFLGIRQDPWRLDRDNRPPGVGWIWLTPIGHPSGFWFMGKPQPQGVGK